AAEFARASEAITKEAREQCGIFRERDHAVAYVAGWKHLQLFAQSARRASIVRDSHDCRKRFEPHALSIACAYKLFQTGQQCGESRAAAYGYQFQTMIRFSKRQVFYLSVDGSSFQLSGIISERQRLSKLHDEQE